MNRAISEALNAFGGAVFLLKNTWDLKDEFGCSHENIFIYSKESVVFNVAIKSDRRGAIFGNAGMRKKMGEAAVWLLNPVIIWGGTVEFWMKRIISFFLEMNTRLQVEHPLQNLLLDWIWSNSK
jgi:hypothetical protein